MANFLIPQSKYIANGVTVNKYILNEKSNPKAFKWAVSAMDKPIGITIHNTDDITVAAGTNSAEQYTRATVNGNMGGVLVHYYIKGTEVWQNLELDTHGWHSSDGRGDGNMRTIAIEIIETGKNAETEQTAIKLIAYLLDKYGWNADNLYTHKHWSPAGKNCPAYILPRWDEFKASCAKELGELAALKSSRAEPVTVTTNNKSKLYRVQAGAFTVRENAENVLEKIKAAGIDAFIVYS